MATQAILKKQIKAAKDLLAQLEKELEDLQSKPEIWHGMTVWERITQISSEIGILPIKMINPEYNHGYTPLPALMEALQPLLDKYNLGVTNRVEEGKIAIDILCRDSSVPFEDQTYFLELPLNGVAENDAQSLAAAITYTRRIGLSLIFNLSTETDSDGNLNSPVEKRKSKDNPKSGTPLEGGPVLKDKDFKAQLKEIESCKSWEEGKDMALRLAENFILTDEQKKSLNSAVRNLKEDADA